MTGIFSGEVPGKLTAGDAHHKKSRGGQAEVVNRGFDRTAECNRLTATVRESIAMTGLVEFGAVGLGLVFKILLKTAAADTTRMVGTGVLGLVVIPLRRSVAKREFPRITVY